MRLTDLKVQRAVSDCGAPRIGCCLTAAAVAGVATAFVIRGWLPRFYPIGPFEGWSWGIGVAAVERIDGFQWLSPSGALQQAESQVCVQRGTS